MKKKAKTLILALGLCIATLSFTACGNIKGIYDFFSDSDLGEAFENLENLDGDDIKNLVDNLKESDYEGLIDDLAEANDNTDSSDYSTDSESEEVNEDENNTSDAADNFDLGNVDGSIYSNSFLGLMCEFDSPWYYYDEDELALVNNLTADMLSDAGFEQAKDAMESGITYVIMCVQNMENNDLVNISVSYSPIDYSKYLSVEDMLDTTIAQLEEVYSSQAYQYVSINRSTTTFMGETVPCIDMSINEDGTPIYQKQVIAMFNNYTAVVTATSYTDFDTAQEHLEAFSAY